MSGSIVISNLPLSCSTYELNTFFNEIGLIKRCFLIKDAQKQFTGKAQITYREDDHAQSAVDKHDNSTFKDNVISVRTTAMERHKEGFGTKNDTTETNKRIKPDTDSKFEPPSNKKQKLSLQNNDSKFIHTTIGDCDDNNDDEHEYHTEQLGRVVIKNIPIKTNEDNVRQYFGKYGAIEEVSIPRNNHYKKRNGCVFIQFSSAEVANKVVKECNKIKMMDTTITVSHAVSKGKFQQAAVVDQPDEDKKKKKLSTKQKRRIRSQLSRLIVRNLPFEATEDDVKKYFNKCGDVNEVIFPEKKGCGFVQFSTREESTQAIEKLNLKDFMGRSIVVGHALPKDQYQKTTTVSNPNMEPIKIEGGDNDAELPTVKVKQERVSPSEHNHNATSKDVEEGRTLFLSQLAIDTTEFSVKTLLANFGEVKYVMIVKDKLSEQSKGVAFAQFVDRDSADACLAAGEDPSREDELSVDGRVLKVLRATGRGAEPETAVKPKGKDKRNLYLAREGFIRTGTQAANGVSIRDMQMRRLREQAKQKLLNNLQMFVSPTRLCVNNLPLTMKDPQLKEIFLKHSPNGAKVTEAKVMRFLGQVDETGAAMSRGYGFVTFNRHDHALTTLRTVNNNPTVFTANARPIVEFSIESKAAMNLKEKRLKKSKEVNAKKKAGESSVSAESDESAKPSFAGYVAKKGDLKPGQKLHRHLGTKIRKRDTKKGGAPANKSKRIGKPRPGGKSKSGKVARAGSKARGKPTKKGKAKK